MSFLTIPHQDSIMIRKMARGRTALGGDSNNNDDEEEEEDEEGGEDDEEDVRLIPRCSPVPRKRGASIFDETAEYMRIQRALPAGKRVAFADTTGGDLVDVHEFVAFDSDDESEIAKWEEEEAKYRKPELEPTYEVRPEFSAPDGSALLRAVRSGKVEVERLSPVEGEPLAFSGIIRVLNISFDKAVYIRSTMDGWGTYFDYPAEYVPGSNDGDTDQFSFKLSFAPPYITHGSRIEFVIRYETSHGDFWANNSSMNYAVTLLLSYEDEALLKKAFVPHARSILKPPKVYSMDDDHLLSDDEQEKEEEESRTSNPVLARPIPVCPVIVQEEIDVETAVHPSGSPATPSHESPSVDGTLSAHTVFPSEQFPCTSSETTLLTNSGPVLCASESVQPTKSEPPPSFHCDLHNHVTEQPVHCSASAPPPAAAPCPSPPQSTERSDASQAEEEQSVASEGSGPWDPASEINLLSTTTEDAATHLEPPAECASSPTGTLEQTAAGGLSELEGSTSSTEHCGGSTPSPVSPVAETQASLGGESEAPSSPELTSVNTDSTKVAHCGGSTPSPVSPVAETQASLGGESEAPSSPELTSVNTDSTKVAHCGGSTPSPVSPVAETQASLGGESEAPSSPELTSVNTDSTMVAHCGGSTPSPVSPVAETQASLGGESQAPSSPELTSVNTDSTKVSHNVDPSPSVSALDEREHASCISPGTSVESAPSTPSEVSEPQSELDASANLMPGVYFLSGVVSLSIMMQEPSTLFLIGLLMVLRRL
ncbi:protein phosphatase 1 regulatory subunit 3A isoform X2 [Cololabis saira]|uniref:protein phosphatase 1 regulatory subunit 3A isoform X2 n=1 Tax=Cololabis saira TaxID=129043 RepID=UPI002AD1F320|nr:protein phosphatase 1 regulatory subunit 3A isoform X2 [Cololabis saira]